MRKVLFIIVFICAAALAGAYFYFYQPLKKTNQIEAVLPSDTVTFVRICELKEQIDRFQAGRLGQSLAKIDLDRLMNSLEIPLQDQNEIKEMLQNIKAAIESGWFDTLFGQDITLALQDLQIEAIDVDNWNPDIIMDSAVVVARPKQPTRILESLNSMLSTQLDVKTEKYLQWEIKHVRLENNIPLYYALSDGLMIAALSPKPVKRCLDQSLKPDTSLLQSELYKKNAAELFKPGKTNMMAYGDMHFFLNTIMETLSNQSHNQDDLDALKLQFERMKGIQDIAFASYDDGGPLVHSKMIMGVDKKAMSPEIALAINTSPGSNPTIGQIPADTLLYSWQNTFDIKVYWEMIQKDPELTPEMINEIKEAFKVKTGITLDQFLDTFDNQIGIMIKAFNMDGMFPIPELALFVKVKETETINTLIKGQINQTGMPLMQEDHKGSKIEYMVLPVGGNMSPSYTFSNGFFMLAINRELLKSMLDTDKQNDLTTNSGFKAVDKGLSGENNQVGYLAMEDLITQVQSMIDVGLSWMAMAKPQDMAKAKELVDVGVNPLLEGLKMYKSLGSRTYSEKDRICSEMYVSLDR